MLFQIVQEAIEWLQANAALMAMVWGIVEYLKRLILAQQFEWMKDWYITALAFVVSFLFAIPAGGFPAVGADPIMYIAHSILLGLATTGVYKVATTMVRKATGMEEV